MVRKGFIALSVVVLSLFQIGSCLRCYDCMSDADLKCTYSKRHPDVHIHDCLPDSKCGRAVIETSSGDVIIRKCFDDFYNCETLAKVTIAKSSDEKVKHCTTCSGNLCNFGPSNGTTSTATTTFLIPFFSLIALYITQLYYR